MGKEIENYLDDHGRIKQWPSKMAMKLKVLAYLSTKFDNEVQYTETEVNEILKKWHTFNDYFILRRGLIDVGWLKRQLDGSRYWKNPKKTVSVDSIQDC
jgi:hypothetical protein